MWLRRRSSSSRMETTVDGQGASYTRVPLEIDNHSLFEGKENIMMKDPGESETTTERLSENSSSDDQYSYKGDDNGLPRLLGSRKQPVIKPSNGKKTSMDIRKQDVEKFSSQTNEDPVNHYKGYVKLCLSGVVVMAFAYAVYIVNPLQLGIQILLAMKDGSFLFSVWKAPPIKVLIKVFIFNITNAQEFLSGEDSKLKLEEVGPYVYSETVTNDNITWNINSTLTFTPKREIQFEPEMSVGDPKDHHVIVPNVALLGISSMIHKSSIALNIGLSTLVSYLNPKPIEDLSVEDYLWGYNDSIVSFASKAFPSWIDFQKFGLLDRMFDEGDNRITIATEDTNDTHQFTVIRYNGSPRLPEWERASTESSSCDKVEGTFEGMLLPRTLQEGQPLTVYRKAFCRPLPLKFNGTSTERGFLTFSYTLADDALDPANPENACYCTNGHCLPLGLSDLSPCYYQIPVAMSMPHFYGADPSLLEPFDGLNPEKEKHASLLELQPDAGVPLRVHSRIQLNLIMGKTRFIPRIRKFNSMALPVIWIEVEMDVLPKYIRVLLHLMLISGPIIQTFLIGTLLALGFLLLFAANIRYAWVTGLFGNRHSATLISYRMKQAQQQQQRDEEKNSIWAGQYAQLLPIPLNNIATSR